MVFCNRTHAGRRLAGLLMPHTSRTDVIVMALPRGGVPVGAEVADALKVPLDVLIVRKLGVPGQEELAMGAIASGGVRELNHTRLLTLWESPARNSERRPGGSEKNSCVASVSIAAASQRLKFAA